MPHHRKVEKMPTVSKMKLNLPDRLLRRELGDLSGDSAIRSLYGVNNWIDDLDIVDELGGHAGCINALRYVKPCLDDQVVEYF